jgi:hypothetical protein
MRAVGVLAAVLVTAGVAGLGAAAPAFAGTTPAAGIPTSITLASTYPQYYGPSFTERSVTLVGALVNAQNGADADILGERVTITEQIAGSGPWKTVATTTTSPTAGSTDDLDVTLNNLTAGGIFKAEFAGDVTAGYAASTSSPLNVETDESTVTINWGYSPSLPIRPNTTETFTGTAYVNDNGVHLPVPGAIVTLYNGLNPTKARTTTAKNGSFKLAVKPTATANWTAQVSSVVPWPYNLYAGSSVAVRVLVAPNVYRTRVLDLALPARQEVHTPIRITGLVQDLRRSAWKPLGSVGVAFYYRILPKGNWVYAGSTKTVNIFGTFSWREPMWAIGDLAWQARVEPTIIGASGFPSSSAARDGILVDRTYLQVSARSENGETSMNALVLDHTQNSPPYMYIANVTGVVKFYNRPKGTKTWRYLGSARVQSNGQAAFSMKATLNGNYQAVFPAQGYFLASSAIAPS